MSVFNGPITPTFTTHDQKPRIMPMNNPTERRHNYEKLCLEESNIPIFSQPWWLDAVCGESGWDVCLAETKGQIVGAFPFYCSRRFLFRLIDMPPLTQNFKLWIKYPESKKNEKRLSHEKAVITQLAKQLPPHDFFRIFFHHSLTNWLPFYWLGFQQTTAYTYVVEDLSDLDAVFRRFSHAKRKNIKRAETALTMGPELTPHEFVTHHRMTLGKQAKTISYKQGVVERIFHATYARGCGKVFTAMDAQQNIHAAIFVAWDPVQAYYLISSIDPDYKTSGAASFLIKEAMMYVSTKTTRFDFEGSMIEGIERSFRQFGTKQVPYFSISRTPSKLCETGLFLRRCYK